MRKEKLLKSDGRYIIYYSFDDEEPADESDAAGPAPETEPGKEKE